MSYALISDDLLLQLEGAGLSRDARLLHLEAIVYSCTAHTDGAIRVRLPRFSDAPDIDACAQELIDAGLWTATGDGFQIVDYLMHQKSKEEIDRRKAEAAHRADRYRRHKRGDHSKCTKSGYCPDGALSPASRVTSRATNTKQTRDVRSPIQSNPIRSKGKGLDCSEEASRPTAPQGASGRSDLDKQLQRMADALFAHGWLLQTTRADDAGDIYRYEFQPKGDYLSLYLTRAIDEDSIWISVLGYTHCLPGQDFPKLNKHIEKFWPVMQKRAQEDPHFIISLMQESSDWTDISYGLDVTHLSCTTPEGAQDLAAQVDQFTRFLQEQMRDYNEAVNAD